MFLIVQELLISVDKFKQLPCLAINLTLWILKFLSDCKKYISEPIESFENLLNKH